MKKETDKIFQKWRKLIVKEFDNTQKYCIYLVHEVVPLYVGITSKFDIRYKSHMRNFGKLGYNNIEISFLEFTNDKKREEYFINEISNMGYDLHNKTLNKRVNNLPKIDSTLNYFKTIRLDEEIKDRLDAAILKSGFKMGYGKFIKYMIDRLAEPNDETDNNIDDDYASYILRKLK